MIVLIPWRAIDADLKRTSLHPRPMHCPKCGTEETAVAGTRDDVVIYRCKSCGHRFGLDSSGEEVAL
jgi:transposase-like protein